MHLRISLAVLSIVLLFSVGCRTGEYKFDHEIYAAMPGIIAAEPFFQGKIYYHEPDSTPELDEKGNQIIAGQPGEYALEFDKGSMLLWFAYGVDPDTRQKVASKAFDLFHEQYINNVGNKKEDGTYRRQLIYFKGYVDDTEMYILEWQLGKDSPSELKNREGNYI